MQMSNFLFTAAAEMGRDFIVTRVREVVAAILASLYFLIGGILEIVFSVARLDDIPMMKEMYQGIQDRFYVIIGVFMLFKVTVSMITYFANPDKITDKEMGTGKLITRIITVLLLLIFVPQYVFPKLTEVQLPLLNTLGKIVLDSDVAMDQTHARTAGQTLATTIYGGFFEPEAECGGDTDVTDNIFDTAVSLAGEPCDNSKKVYKYKFNFIGALFCVIPILVLLIIIGVQVAIRAFKLIVLKIIAPIPIISYLDPKSMKDGGKTSVYVKMFLTAYLDLFIHFGVLYFVVELTAKLYTTDLMGLGGATVQLVGQTKVFGMVFVIIGFLLFAFQAPKYIKKALGLKDQEFGAGLAGMLTAGVATAGAVGSGVAGFKASASAGGHLIHNLGAGISSAISGANAAYRGAGDKGDVMAGLRAVNEKNAQLRANRAAGVTGSGALLSGIQSVFTGQTQADILEGRIKDQQDFSKAIDAVSNRAKSEMVKKTETRGSITKGGNEFVNYKSFSAAMNAAKSAGQSEFDYTSYTKRRDAAGNVMTDAHGNALWDETTQRMSMQDAEMNIGWIEKDNTNDYLRQAMNGGIDDMVMRNLVDDVTAKGKSISVSSLSTFQGAAGVQANADLQAAGYVGGINSAVGDNFSIPDLNALKKVKDYVDMATTNDTRENQKNIANKNVFYGKSNK